MKNVEKKIDLKKQLLAAIAMLVVSAVALSSATYAWFANSKDVTAKGMKVNAVADSSLLIKGSDEGEVFGSVGTTTEEATSMKVCTSIDGKNFAALGKDVKVNSATSSTATWSGESGAFKDGDLVTVNNSESDEYYIEATYYIKSMKDAADIYVSSISTTDAVKNAETGNKMYKAIRASVAIKDSTNNEVVKVYNPFGGANNDSKLGSYNSGTKKWTLAADTSAYTGTTKAKLWNLAAGTEYTVTIRVWFEGQDTHCYTDAVTTTVDCPITVVFTKWEADPS